jgi:hypothetical protein
MNKVINNQEVLVKKTNKKAPGLFQEPLGGGTKKRVVINPV